MTEELSGQAPAGEFIMFASDDGEVRVECRFEQETLWLPQATIATFIRLHRRPLHSTSKGSTKKAKLNKMQPVSLTYKFSRKAVVR